METKTKVKNSTELFYIKNKSKSDTYMQIIDQQRAEQRCSDPKNKKNVFLKLT